MKYSIQCLYLIVTSVVAFKHNLCIECKHFKKDVFSEPRFGKCTLFPIVIEDDEYAVTGKKPRQSIDHQFCTIVRKHGDCGKEGTLFEAKD